MKQFPVSIKTEWKELDKILLAWAKSYFGPHANAEGERDESYWYIGLKHLLPSDREKFDALFEKYDSNQDYEPDMEWSSTYYCALPEEISNCILFSYAGFPFDRGQAFADYSGVIFLPEDEQALSFCIGNIFSSNADIIVHQVNCQGVMGAGLAKQVKSKYPQVFQAYQQECRKPEDSLLGSALIVDAQDGRYIANCFAQKGYGRQQQQTDYAALRSSLQAVRSFAEADPAKSVAIPYGIGCGLGGGDWRTVLEIITQTFAGFNKASIWRKPPRQSIL